MGNDIYNFYRGYYTDVITDTGGSDTIDFNNVTFANMAVIIKSGGDLVINFRGYSGAGRDKITIKNWSDSSPVIETFRFDKTDYEYSIVNGRSTLVKKTTSIDEIDVGDVGFTDSDSDEGYTDLLGLPSDFSLDLL